MTEGMTGLQEGVTDGQLNRIGKLSCTQKNGTKNIPALFEDCAMSGKVFGSGQSLVPLPLCIYKYERKQLLIQLIDAKMYLDFSFGSARLASNDGHRQIRLESLDRIRHLTGGHGETILRVQR